MSPPEAQEVRTVEELALARVLEECLQAMEQGESDMEALAARYPEASDEIRPLLEIALQLRSMHRAGPPVSVEFLEGLRERLVSSELGPRR